MNTNMNTMTNEGTEMNNTYMPTTENNSNYDMQQILNITGQTAMNIQAMSKQMGIVTTAINSLTDDVSIIKTDIDQLKLNEEVTTTQAEVIIEVATKRTVQILGEDALERQKYFRIFIKKLYSDARHYAGLGNKIARTKKGDFQRVIDYIESWVPSCGFAALRTKADKNAEARKIARSQGYVA